MLYNILLIVQIVVSVSIIGLVLIQHGKGADAGAAFGSGASGTVFGSRGSGNFLSRTTAILATVFFLNCLALAWIVAHQPETTSLVDQAVKTEKAATPAATTEVPASKADAETAPVASDKKPAEANSPANEIPADTGTAETAAPATVDKTSDIPE